MSTSRDNLGRSIDTVPRIGEQERVSLREFVESRESVVQQEGDRTTKPPRLEQRNLQPLAVAGGRGVLKLIGEGGISGFYIGIDSLSDLVTATKQYDVSNFTERRTLDASTATLSELIDFVCTLVTDLKSTGPLG